MRSKPLLCVTVTAPTMAELRRRRDAVGDADLIELRLDSVCDPNVEAALAGRTRPVIVTCRPTWEGGLFSGPEDERRRLLGEALDLGAEWVDIEWRARFDDLVARTGGRRVVLSAHDFDDMPRDLESRAAAMRSTGAEVVKVAVRTRHLRDCLPLVGFGRQGGMVVIGMGEHGLATRVLAGHFGSMWTYAGRESEVGQVTATTLLEEFRFRRLTDATGIYGIVGNPVRHSVSPAMHNAAFRALDLDAVYLPLPASDADDFVAFARALGVKGASVTTPYKVAMLERVDEVDAVGRQVGAINTVRIDNERWLGANTDVAGFLAPLQGVAARGMRASVLGAGGAARGVAMALASVGSHVRVHARDRVRAEDVAALAGGQVGPWPPERGSWDLLVNCTPIGMYPNVDTTPIGRDLLTGRVVYDLMYNPPTTRMLQEAGTAGCQTIGGLEMLVAQADAQFQWWTSARPPRGVMREAAVRRLAEFSRDEHYVV